MSIDLKKTKHIIWDWNGTLIDDAWLCVEILNQISLRHQKQTIDLDQYRSWFDFPVKDFYTKMGFDFAIDSFERIAVEYIDEYNRRRFECRLHEHAEKLLEYFGQADITQSILSAYQHDMLAEAIEYYKLKDFFVKLSGLNDFYAESKIESGKILIEGLGFDKSHILLIGDTAHDFEVANSIGVDCVLVANGHNSYDKLLGCDKPVFENLGQLIGCKGKDQICC